MPKGATNRPHFLSVRTKTPWLGWERRDTMAFTDQEILDLCRTRDQRAIAAMEFQYGAYCHKVAVNILGNFHDAEECVNDAYLAVWNAVPPRPAPVPAGLPGQDHPQHRH